MSATPPPGPKDFNDAFKTAFGDDRYVVSKAHVDNDKIARITVTFNGKEYHVTVGSEFIKGWDDKNQEFAKQLGFLLQTMHEHALETGFVKGSTFSCNGGEPIDLNKVGDTIKSTNDEIKKAEDEKKLLETKHSDLSTTLQKAEQEMKELAPKKTWIFGSPEYPKDEATYTKAVDAHQKAQQAVHANTALYTEQEEKLKKLREELTKYKVADLFAKKLHPDIGAISVVAGGPSPTPSAAPAAAAAAAAPPAPTAPLPPLPDAAPTPRSSSGAPAAAAAAAAAAADTAGPSSSATGTDAAAPSESGLPGYNTAVRDSDTAPPPGTDGKGNT